MIKELLAFEQLSGFFLLNILRPCRLLVLRAFIIDEAKMKGTSIEKDIGIVLLLVSLVCLGTWPALLRLASTVLLESSLSSEHHQQQERQAEATSTKRYSSSHSTNGAYSSLDGNPADAMTILLQSNEKNPSEVVCHAYLDYATAYFLASSIPFVIAALMSTDNLQSGLSHRCLWWLSPWWAELS
jgi:hypothetical protein